MKKKLMTILACFVMILVGGLTLAGCGDPEEQGPTEISVTEAAAFIDEQDLNGGFTGGYELTIAGLMTTQVKFENNKVVALKYEAGQGEESYKVYITDNKAYLDLGEGYKVWTTMDVVETEGFEYADEYQQILAGLDVTQFTSMIKTDIISSCDKIIKKVDGNKTELVCQAESHGVTMEATLVFVDGKLELLKSTQAGKDVTTLKTISTITFPDLSGFEPYTADAE